jgi:serine protease AprX
MVRIRRGSVAVFGAIILAAGLVNSGVATGAPTESKQAYLIQFTGTLSDAQRAELRGMGAGIGAYMPDLTYVGVMDDSARAAVSKLGYVRSVSDYHAADKLDADTAVTASSGDAQYLITLVEQSTREQWSVVGQIRRLGGRMDVVSASGQHLVATLRAEQVAAVARLPEVLAVGVLSAPESDMDTAREATGANFVETAGGYQGQGVRGEVMDGGLRTSHQEFRARPTVLHGPNSTNTGQHMARSSRPE